MINMEKHLKTPCHEVMKYADAFFTNNGLESEDSNPEQFCAHYSGGGGYVSVQCCPEDNHTRVLVEGREWEYQIKEFMKKL
jgi:hypothetical protein